MQDKEIILDKIPTSTDLLKLIEIDSYKDPRSIYYQRNIVRPKLFTIGFVINVTIILIISVASAFGTYYLSNKLWLKILVPITLCILYIFIRLKAFLIYLVKMYQRFAPEKTRNRCRYEPSCSQYMILSIQKYGVFKGVKKGINRWKSCCPPNGGFDEP